MKQQQEGKTYKMRLTLDEAEHRLLLQKQQQRKLCRLPFLSLEKLVKMYMIEGLFQRTFLEQRESSHV